MFRFILTFPFAMVLGPLPMLATAKTVQTYSSVRGWIVDSVYENGQFSGCLAAQKYKG
jgi:hypothetical protein